MRTSLGVAALLLAVAVPASAQRAEDPTAREARDRFELFTECIPMSLLVTVQITDNDEIALTNTTATRAVRSRLRAARIYSNTTSDTTSTVVRVTTSIVLRVHIHVVGPAYSIGIEFVRWLWGEHDAWWATTWDTRTLGTHANDATYLLGVLSKYMDTFIDEYLRVNAAACG